MPYNIRKVKNQPCYKVVNSETGKIHSKCTTKKKAQAQVRLLHSLEQKGEGFTDIARAVVDKLLPQRQAGKLSPKSRTLLQGITNETITSLECVRTPIESYIDNVLNTLSFGKWKQAVKQTGYDRLFHLSLFINKTYVFHKIEVLTLVADKSIIKSNSEVKSVGLPSVPITIGQLIQKTKDFMGDQKFTSYDPVANNCQDLVLSVLKANNLNTQELEAFVKQDAVKIFEKNPSWVGKFAQGVTDIAGRVNRLIEGEGQQKGGDILEDIGSLLGFGRPRKVRAKRPPNVWQQALKKWNGQSGTWCIPRKGSKQYDEVKKIAETIKRGPQRALPVPPEEEKKSPPSRSIFRRERSMVEEKADGDNPESILGLMRRRNAKLEYKEREERKKRLGYRGKK